MITITCDTIEERDNMIKCINKSDYCPFGKLESCSLISLCEECMSNKIKFIVKEEVE